MHVVGRWHSQSHERDAKLLGAVQSLHDVRWRVQEQKEWDILWSVRHSRNGHVSVVGSRNRCLHFALSLWLPYTMYIQWLGG